MKGYRIEGIEGSGASGNMASQVELNFGVWKKSRLYSLTRFWKSLRSNLGGASDLAYASLSRLSSLPCIIFVLIPPFSGSYLLRDVLRVECLPACLSVCQCTRVDFTK